MKYLSCLLVGAAVIAPHAMAQPYPDKSKTIKMVVPFAPGTATDVNSRDFAQLLSDVLKQPVVVDNKLGGEGSVAAQALVSAPADGYTILYTSSSLPVVEPLLKKNLPYSPTRDFAPICTVSLTRFVLNITGDSPYKSPADVIAAAKANPGKLTYAYSTGTTRVAAELFARGSGIQLTGVPYKSGITALTEVAGGQVDMMIIDHVTALPFIQSGKIRALTTFAPKRIKALPEVPSSVEAGVPGEVKVWFGVFGSAKTPPAVLAQMRQAVELAMKKPEMASMLEKRGLEPMAICGESMTKFLAEEVDIYRAVLKKAGIEPQ
ncbi:tripartite tricarboxylate transporter substrate binding protein [Variovorax paradoxus]|nr:tripartite tricarboxylate transporter substrate binding protein [Variovorax paradoxus]MBT2305094.1 tripartite tricarboxylate transporter substrate binding protein [Variovorax paradoxus]